MKKRKSHIMSPAGTALVLLLGILLAAMTTLALEQGSLLSTLESFRAEPVLFVLNLWPVAAMALLVYFLLGNAWYSVSFTTLVWGLLSYVNLVKVEARGDPFVPGDILLLTEGIEAAGNYQLDMHWGKLALLLGLCLLLAFMGIRLKSSRPRLPLRLLAALGVAAAFVVTMIYIYPDQELYEKMKGPNRANVPAVYHAFGFPYCFLHNFNLYPIDTPPGYSSQEAATYETRFRKEPVSPDTAPNILMVMCEAFTDLPNASAFTYTEEENPIAAYNRLAESTLSGHLIVSNTGAGTANTEFDVLTGMMTNRIGTGTTSAFRTVHRNTDSIPRMLNEAGYRTFLCTRGKTGSTTGKVSTPIWVFQIRYSRMHLTPRTTWGNGFPMKPFSGCWSSPWRSGRGIRPSSLTLSPSKTTRPTPPESTALCRIRLKPPSPSAMRPAPICPSTLRACRTAPICWSV